MVLKAAAAATAAAMAAAAGKFMLLLLLLPCGITTLLLTVEQSSALSTADPEAVYCWQHICSAATGSRQPCGCLHSYSPEAANMLAVRAISLWFLQLLSAAEIAEGGDLISAERCQKKLMKWLQLHPKCV